MNTKEKYNQFSITKNLIQTRLEDFTLTEKAILICLVSYMKKDNKSRLSCYVGQKTIASKMKTSPKTVIAALKKFESLGFIVSEKRVDNSKIYTWVGISETERDINRNKVKRSKEEWEAYYKNKPELDRLEAEFEKMQALIQAKKERQFDVDNV